MICSNSLGFAQPALGGHRQGEFHRIAGRRLADLAGGELRVLFLNGLTDIADGEVQFGHAVRLEPDAHGVVGLGKQRNLTGAGDALEFVHHVDVGVVADEIGVLGAVGADRRDHQDVGGSLLDGETVLAHVRRHQRIRQIDPVGQIGQHLSTLVPMLK